MYSYFMERTKSIEKVELPDGKYYGDWCAYSITIHLPDWKDKPIKVNNGIRGMSRNEIVEVVDGWLYVVE
jgi:hypothetical protein